MAGLLTDLSGEAPPFARALLHLEDSEWLQAFVLLDHELGAGPCPALCVLDAIAHAWVGLGFPERAAAVLDLALTLPAAVGEARAATTCHLAGILGATGNPRRALLLYEEVLGCSPHHAVARASRAALAATVA